MSSVINSPDDLERFLDHLLRFNRELADSFARMRSHWVEIGAVWQDAQYGRFGERLDEAESGIEHYLATTEEQEHHLHELIERLRAVQNLR